MKFACERNRPRLLLTVCSAKLKNPSKSTANWEVNSQVTSSVTPVIIITDICVIRINTAALSIYFASAGVHLEMTYEHVAECDDDLVDTSDDALAPDANVLYTSSCDPR